MKTIGSNEEPVHYNSFLLKYIFLFVMQTFICNTTGESGSKNTKEVEIYDKKKLSPQVWITHSVYYLV